MMADAIAPQETAESIIEVHDRSLNEAEAYARILSRGGHVWVKAYAHRTDGLTVTTHSGVAYHFSQPGCGQDRSESRMAAEIISMLGIAREDVAWRRLRSEGAYALGFNAD